VGRVCTPLMMCLPASCVQLVRSSPVLATPAPTALHVRRIPYLWMRGLPAIALCLEVFSMAIPFRLSARAHAAREHIPAIATDKLCVLDVPLGTIAQGHARRQLRVPLALHCLHIILLCWAIAQHALLGTTRISRGKMLAIRAQVGMHAAMSPLLQ